MARPNATPASASRNRACAGRRIAAATCHSATIANPAITMSSMAMRLWMNQAKSVASSTIPASVANRRWLAHHSARPKANSPSVPMIALGKRQLSA